MPFMRFISALPILAALMGAPAASAAECGIASWYGHGAVTANGEEFDLSAMTAAHKTLPFGTVVQVQNLRNGRDIFVRINDRGPFVDGRIIDLSFAAALSLGLAGPGIAPVRVTVLSGKDTTTTGWRLTHVRGGGIPSRYVDGHAHSHGRARALGFETWTDYFAARRIPWTTRSRPNCDT